jgi:outer membrane receptor for ferrienterochelin and colicins
MSLNKNNIITFFLLMLSVFVLAQSSQHKDSLITEKLDEVVVTATRTKRQLSSLPTPVQIVSKTDIKQSNSLRLSDILNEQTGLITVPDFGGGEGIQLQGLDSQYTLIMIDGVPLIGRSAGTLDLDRITVGNIKQIEIVLNMGLKEM